MPRTLFLPTARQTNWLLVIGFASVGYALYLRYLVIQMPAVALACEAGLPTWTCLTRRMAVALFQHSVFGWTALAVALLNFIRPSLSLFGVALAAAGLGIVLFNVSLSALAAALLVLSLARSVSDAA
jgi:hypothetical protein